MEKFNKRARGQRRRWMVLISALLGVALLLSGCSSEKGETGVSNSANLKEKIVFADVSWDSVQVHNRVAGFIIEKGYGYPVDYMFGESIPTLQAVGTGDIDVIMEVWADNYPEVWNKILDEGTGLNLGSNFPDSSQGWYVPTYMIKGDSERGIKPVTPDLKSVTDLPKYWEVFKDAEVPTKGRFHQSPAGWGCTKINEEKFETYGLGDKFNLFSTGSQTALSTSMVSAYEKGKPWLGYYWEPTWVMGKLDMTLLKEAPYDQEIWDKNKACCYPPSTVLKTANIGMKARAPEVLEFLDKYETTTAQTNAALAFMQDHDGDTQKAAIWFLEQNREMWGKWVPDDVFAKVEQALNEVK